MPPALGPSPGTRGLHVPCLFWPTTYLPQEIEHVGVSPDGTIAVAACSSGQVYIWRCGADEIAQHGDGVHLDPLAFAVCGWQGPTKLAGIDFCRAGPYAASSGLKSAALVVCILEDWRLRLLDPADGRCVAVVPPRLSSDPASVVARVLQDGRHVALAGDGTSEPVLVDLWTGRQVAALSVQGDVLQQLASPLESTGDGHKEADGHQADDVYLAAQGSKRVFVWRWRRPSEPTAAEDAARRPGLEGVGKAADRAEPCASQAVMRSYARGDGRSIALCFERSVLLLALPDRCFVWIVGDSGMQPLCQVQLPSSGVWGGETAEFAGAQLLHLCTRGPGSGEGTAVSHRPREAARKRSSSWAPGSAGLLMPNHHAQSEAKLMMVAWTTEGKVLCSELPDLGDPKDDDISLRPWGSLPAPLGPRDVVWRCCESLLIGVSLGPSADVLYLRAAARLEARPAWRRAADIGELWRASVKGPKSRTVLCSAVVEVERCAMLVLAMAESNEIQTVPLGVDAPVRRLAVPDEFRDATCIQALGPHFVVASDSRGLVAWWSLPDWRLAGSAAPPSRVPVVCFARVWSPRGGEHVLFPEHALVAALDELGKGRLINLEAGEVLCIFQSQRGPELWYDEPLRVVYDRTSRYVCISTPTYACAWDAGSGAFDGGVQVPLQDDTLERFGPLGRCENAKLASTSSLIPNAAVCTPGLRCPILRSPGIADGSDSVVWQPSSWASSEVAPWSCGDLPLDGPLWRLPVIVFSPANFFARSVGARPPEGSPPSNAGSKDVTPLVLDTTDSATIPWPVGDTASGLMARLVGLGLYLQHPPFAIGVLGVDGSPSFLLPRPHVKGVRSAPASPRGFAGCRPIPERREHHHSRGWSSVEASVELLELLAASCGGKSPAIFLKERSLACCSCPQVGFTLIARFLMLASSPQMIQRCALPALRQLVAEAPVSMLRDVVRNWLQVLRSDARDSPSFPPADGSLRFCTFGSVTVFREASGLLLGLTAVALRDTQPKLFDVLLPGPAVALIAEVVCHRMFSRTDSGLQIMCCEVFALGFPLWRRYLAVALPRRRGSTAPSSVAAAASAAATGTARATAVPAVVAGAGPPASAASGTSRPVGAASAGAGAEKVAQPLDPDLELFTAQVFGLYQEPHLASSCMSLMMQVGARDPLVLLHVMARAARKLDQGAAYTSSALLVLVTFIHKFSAKVIPLLPKFTEAVLRCLEPSDPALRRQSLMAVTSALHQLVQTFPMVAFHQDQQRFGVGTSDGLVVVYDLRTATKWRILEGHTGAIAALAFSQDGNKVGSYSCRDSSIRVWQCASTGLLGGLLGSGGKCLQSHVLPSLAATSPDTKVSEAWRRTSLTWSDTRLIRLVRESGEVVQIHPN